MLCCLSYTLLNSISLHELSRPSGPTKLYIFYLKPFLFTLCLCNFSLHINESSLSFLYCACSVWERIWRRTTATVFARQQTLWECVLVFSVTHTRLFPRCVGELQHVSVCVLLWHIESIPKLCSLQCSRGLGATHLSFWCSLLGITMVILIGSRYQTPVGGHASLVQSRFEGGQKWRIKECVCMCAFYWWDEGVLRLLCHFGAILGHETFSQTHTHSVHSDIELTVCVCV